MRWYMCVTPERKEAALSSRGMWTGIFMPLSKFQPTTPLPAMQPGGTQTMVFLPATCSMRRSTSSPPQPWQAETPGETMSGLFLSMSR